MNNLFRAISALVLILMINSVKSLHAQAFVFPSMSSPINCFSGAYDLDVTIEVKGIQINTIYYDDQVNNTGSFSFDVIFSYKNDFTGELPNSAPYFWQYQVTFYSSNTNISPASLTNNLANVPIASYGEPAKNLYNNNTFYGSARNLGFQSNTLYTHPDTIKLFGLSRSELIVNLPCMQTSVQALPVAPLYVSLGNFSGKIENHNAVLHWNTQVEENNNRFEIERSFNGIDWVAIGFEYSKAVNGNSKSNLDYTFTDFAPINGKNYYRLKIVDNEELYEYSKVVSIELSDVKKITVYPNPAKDRVYISNLNSGNVVVIFDMLGKEVVKTNVQKSGNNVELNIEKLQYNTYYVVIFDNDKIIQKEKLLVIK